MMHTQKHRALAVIMDPIHAIHYKKDTTLALLWAAQEAGFALYYMELGDLLLQGARAYGVMRPFTVQRDPQCWFTTCRRAASNHSPTWM
jgi:glutathione synthase